MKARMSRAAKRRILIYRQVATKTLGLRFVSAAMRVLLPENAPPRSDIVRGMASRVVLITGASSGIGLACARTSTSVASAYTARHATGTTAAFRGPRRA